MAKNKWFYSFPTFNMSDRFTYFNDLAEHYNDTMLIAMIKQKLYNSATAGVASAAGFLNGDISSEEMLSAVCFLEQVAVSEREKELTVLRNYKETLRQKLPQNKDIDKILKELDNANLDNLQDLDTFYVKLTDCLNVLRQNANDFKDRLDQLKSHQGKKFSDLMKDDMRFRADGDIRAMLHNLTGMATQAQNKKAEGFASLLRSITLKELQKYNVVGSIKSGEDFAVIAAALMLDIETEFQKALLQSGKGDFTELEEAEIQKIISNYEARSIDQQSRIQQALNGNYEDLNTIIFAAKQTLGISSIQPQTQTAIKRQATATQRSNRLTLNNSMYRQFKKQLPKNIFDELPLVTIGKKTKQSHGNLFELLSVLLGDGSKVAGGAATDIISFEIGFDRNPQLANTIRSYTEQIGREYTDFTKKDRDDRKKSTTEAFNQMNENVANITKDLDKFIGSLDIPIDNIFIYHESLKLYGTMETGNASAFHGREMVILSYIDELYSLGGLAGLQLPQQDALAFLAANLSNLAVGASVRGPLEQYFSLFAGLLMFDDVRNIALEATKQVTYSNVTNIHLYNLNGVYVPASMILTYTHQAATKALDTISSGKAAEASISVSGANSVIKKWLEDNTPYMGTNFKAEWAPVAEAVLSGTKVKISFLASFIHLINDLMNI